MGLRLKFNLVLLLVFAIGLGVTAFISHDLLHRNARDEVTRNAGLMMEAAMSMRGYTNTQIRPLIPYGEEVFHPQSVPAYSATEIMTALRKKYTDYSYKEATLNPTNPRNKAVEWETDIVNVMMSMLIVRPIRRMSAAADTPIRLAPATWKSPNSPKPAKTKSRCSANHSTACGAAWPRRST
jgi:hypothetical protein